MTTFKKLEDFQKVNVKYSKIVSELNAKKQEQTQALYVAKNELNKALLADIEGSTKATKDDVAKMKKDIQALQESLSDADQRIDLASEARNQKLKAIFPDVAKEYSVYSQEIHQSIMDDADELKIIRAEFLLKCQELHNRTKQAQSLHSEISSHARIVNIPFNVRLDMPVLNMTSNYAGVSAHLAPLQNEVTQAYQLGQVPAFVELFGITGELVENNKASVMLAEIKSKGVVSNV